MNKKIIVYILLISFMHYLAACTIYRTEEKLPMQAETGQRITKAVMSNGEVITFADAGGSVQTIGASIVGVKKNKMIVIDPEDVIEYRSEVTIIDSMNELKNEKILEVVDINSKLYVFDTNGAEYDPENRIISGINTDGKKIVLKIRDLVSILIKKPVTITLEEIQKDSSIKIAQVILNKNIAHTFDYPGATYETFATLISGVTAAGTFVTLNADDVLYLEIKKLDSALSVFGTVGICAAGIAAVFLIALALKESCPFIYSFDGNSYVFDAEPLGGATTEIYHRSELSLLSHLKIHDGKYKLMITNEVNETQYVDDLSLEYIDHSPDEKIFPDYEGQYYTVKEPAGIISAVDENGNDLSLFLKNDDGTFWMTKMKENEQDINNRIRHEITITLPKPEKAEKVNLIINSGTTIWGSNMIREMLNMYGNSINEYYKKINEGGFEFQQTAGFLRNEELFQMKLYAKSADRWIQKSVINGGGPLVSETRILQIDVSDISGDKLILKFNPPKGFWTFDYFAADYSIRKITNFNSLKISRSINSDEKDIADIVSKEDKNYYAMPEKGMKFFAEFDAPPVPEGKVRTIYSRTSGFYKIHLDNNGPIQSELLYQIAFTPGKIVKLSNQRYFEWLKNLEESRTEVMK